MFLSDLEKADSQSESNGLYKFGASVGKRSEDSEMKKYDDSNGYINLLRKSEQIQKGKSSMEDMYILNRVLHQNKYILDIQNQISKD